MKDERTDDEKRCDRFLYYVHLCATWGPDDALAMYVSDSGGEPPEHHDGACVLCPERAAVFPTMVQITAEMRQSAARLARAVRRRDQ